MSPWSNCAEPSGVIDYELLFVGATDVDLQTTIDFTPPSEWTTHNQMTIGQAERNKSTSQRASSGMVNVRRK